MSKRTPTMKVHQLAKELGVSSKDIVAKCAAEQIPGITNHMSQVNAGLSETIRQWFGSASGVATAVETAAPVDLSTVKVKAKRPSRAKTIKTDGHADDSEADSGSDAVAVEVVEPVTRQIPAPRLPDAERPIVRPSLPPDPAPVAPAAKEEHVAPAQAAASAPEAPTIAPAPPKEAPPGSAPAERTPAAAKSSAASRHAKPQPSTKPAPSKPVMNVPERPKVVKPVGPMLDQPKKINLAGPRVIRVENPEVLPEPRSRSSSGGAARGGPRGGRGAEPSAPPGGGARGRGAPPAGDDRNNRRNKRRSGAGELGTGRVGRAFADNETPFEPWREQDLIEREDRLSRAGGFFRAHKRDTMKRSSPTPSRAQSPAKSGGLVRISEPIYIKELSAVTGVPANSILKQLFLSGVMGATINSVIESSKAIEIMMDHNIELQVEAQRSAAEIIEQKFAKRDLGEGSPRPPVVTILGHVDHGKTSLLDRIRNTNVASGEAGGITQATSAFQVPVRAGERDHVISFIDTPGHEAFTAMRARGAQVTDIAVLVVAADDGVMPQTVESINHAKAANVAIVVALNKIDRPEATDTNIQRILGQLAENGLNPTEWGGTTEVIRTSATKGTGIQELLDVLDYQAQLLDLKAPVDGEARGTVLEAQMVEGRGPVARIIVQEGTLEKGDFIVIGRAFGRVRDIVNDRGERIESAGPSTPAAISGIDALPDAGDKFYVVDSLKAAENAAEERRRIERERALAAPKITLDNIFQHLGQGDRKTLPLVVKADVQGSVETLNVLLSRLSTDEVTVVVKHIGVGGINESDVTLAETTGAIIIGFNVTSSAKARQSAEAKGIDIRLYEVIYNITDDIKKAVEGLLEPEMKLEVLGHAEVRQVFRISKVGAIAGCYITDGVVERNAQIRVTRGGIVVEKDRRLEQLKRFKDDVREVKSGMECGMKIVGYDDIKEGDILECYKTVEVKRQES